MIQIIKHAFQKRIVCPIKNQKISFFKQFQTICTLQDPDNRMTNRER